MKPQPDDCCVLNGGKGAWAFAPLAEQLAAALGIPVAEKPRGFNYLLHVEDLREVSSERLFIPLAAIELAADKRRLAAIFERYGIATPRTVLLETFAEVAAFVAQNSTSEWCLKFPTSCGARGHRLILPDTAEPAHWPRPFVVQEFIRLERPEVYRLFGAGGDVFGWVARRFPPGSRLSPWVAHVRGARYELPGEAPCEAENAARCALQAAGLLESFGCADLLARPSGEWLVLEVGTDGIYNHVDRELGLPSLEATLLQRIAGAFWNWASAAR